MSTRRVNGLDAEMEAINSGKSVEALRIAREEYQRAHVTHDESSAMCLFMQKHSEIANIEANRSILMATAKEFNCVVTEAVLELSLLQCHSSLIGPTPARAEPTPEQSRVENNQKLCAMTSEQLRSEIQRRMPHLKVMLDSLSPECAAITTKLQIKNLSADSMRNMMWKSDGRKKSLNTEHLQNILNGTI